jgi:hypothetical protein
MQQFPDESQMPRSKDGSEPIRGGSIGLNRILNTIVAASNTDKRPRFTGVLISAFTIFRNVYDQQQFPTLKSLDEAFVVDLNLFLDYYNTYLSHVWNHQLYGQKRCPVIVYFPNYDLVPKELEREHTGKRAEIADMYKLFLRSHSSEMGMVKVMEHIRCFFVTAGPSMYPHRELVQKFRDIVHKKDCLYNTGDPVSITTHIPLDLYLSYRLRNLHLLESNTGRIRPASEFNLKLDKEGRVPLQSAVHVVVGDDKMFQPIVPGKVRREILLTAGQERWASRDESDVTIRLSKMTGIPIAKLRQYDFG